MPHLILSFTSMSRYKTKPKTANRFADSFNTISLYLGVLFQIYGTVTLVVLLSLNVKGQICVIGIKGMKLRKEGFLKKNQIFMQGPVSKERKHNKISNMKILLCFFVFNLLDTHKFLHLLGGNR